MNQVTSDIYMIDIVSEGQNRVRLIYDQMKKLFAWNKPPKKDVMRIGFLYDLYLVT